MPEILLHSSTETMINAIIKNPSHAILIIAEEGSGKKYLAKHLITSILETNNLDTYPYYLEVKPDDKNLISIEAIRNINKFLSLKVVSLRSMNRSILIENAQMLSLQAQNALLKTFEEPPKGTVIVLTATAENDLIPPILSRSQIVKLRKPELSKLNVLKPEKMSSIEFSKAVSLSDGNIGRLIRLIVNNDDEINKAANLTKKVLSVPKYNRLLLVDELSKEKNIINDVIRILMYLANLNLKRGSVIDNKWRVILDQSYYASIALSKNANPKLVLINLFINI